MPPVSVWVVAGTAAGFFTGWEVFGEPADEGLELATVGGEPLEGAAVAGDDAAGVELDGGLLAGAAGVIEAAGGAELPAGSP